MLKTPSAATETAE
ncbi:hypothetical protein Tsp_11241, partial [Trichinella spiralis]